jgi:hypothetical protein
MRTRSSHHKLLIGSVATVSLVALSACKPVVGNLSDQTPPKITFTVNGNTVPNNGSYDVFGIGYQVIIKATDSGGIESIETAIENHFTCTAGSVGAAETDTNPSSLKGYDYSIATHSYNAHRTSPDDFWPDVNNNHVKDVAERKLRYNELLVIDDKALVQQSFDAYADGAVCVMPDGTTNGTVSHDELTIRATAKNTRSEILSAPSSQSTATAFIKLA